MRILLFLSAVLMATSLIAQTPVQKIQGTVVDRANLQPLIGAAVEVISLDPLMGTVTDLNGQFVLEKVPVGRHSIRVSYLGYETWETQSAVLTSGRTLVLDIELREAAIQTGEVVVTAYKRDNAPINDAAVVSTRSFSVEETQRYAASVNDPGRLAVGFPGVQPQRDTRTDIFIRGNSASGMIWRLEGIDIPNPNHFARIGSSGGGISIFSASLLATSDFSSGAFPAEYGNAYSGIFDMRFRKGNRHNREYTFRAGILGLDLAAEGPIRKGESSYLVNYRYSTLGILNELGLHLVGPRTSNTFQDLSFVLGFSGHSRHLFTLWGIGGLSRETERVVDDKDDWRSYTDYQTYDFNTDMGALGLSYTWLINDKSYFNSSVAVMGQDIIYRIDTMSRDDVRFTVDDQHHIDSRVTLAGNYNYKFNPTVSLKAGFTGSAIMYNFFRERFSFAQNRQEVITDGRGTTGLVQAYAQSHFRPAAAWDVIAGVRAMYFTLNNTYSIEPRLGVQFVPAQGHTMSLAYGLHGMVLPMGSYFTRDPDNPEALPNKNLDLLQNHHLVLGYHYLLRERWKFGFELYYQHMLNVPVADDVNRTYWLMNEIQSFAREPLVSKGIGYNRGIDVTVERLFDRGVFMILSGSVFSSEYEPLNGQRYSTQFNSRYAGTMMGGYEWQLDNGNALQFGLKTIYTAGLPVTPLLSDPELITDREPPLDESRPFSVQVPDYFRIDARLAWRKNNPRSSWILAIDIQNVTSRKNIDIVRRQFDPDLNQWVYVEMAGLTPLISFQIDF